MTNKEFYDLHKGKKVTLSENYLLRFHPKDRNKYRHRIGVIDEYVSSDANVLGTYLKCITYDNSIFKASTWLVINYNNLILYEEPIIGMLTYIREKMNECKRVR